MDIKLSTIDMLFWQAEMGADEAIAQEVQLANFTQQSISLKKFIAPPPTPAAQPVTLSKLKATSAIINHKSAAQDLESLRYELDSLEGSFSKSTASNLVWGRGKTDKPCIMVIGEAPSADDDRAGLAFSGSEGQFVETLLQYAEILIEDAYFVQSIYWRPPGGMTASPNERMLCQPYLLKHIELIQPENLIVFGLGAYQSLSATNSNLLQLTGQFIDLKIDNDSGKTKYKTAFMPSLAQLLHQPKSKRQAWKVLIEVKKYLLNSN